MIVSGLKDLFINELIPLIEEYKPDKLGDVDPDVKWSAFEGVYEESLHRICMHIALKLELDPVRIYHRRRNNLFINKPVEKLFDIQSNLRNLKKLNSDIELVNSIDKLVDDKIFEGALNRILLNQKRSLRKGRYSDYL